MAESPLPPCSSPFQFKMDHIHLDDAKDFLKKVLEILKCCNYARCNNILRRPLAQCLDGHAICPDCRGSKNKCPLQDCQRRFQDGTNLILQRALDFLPKKCNFEGCDILMRPSIVRRHEMLCMLSGRDRSECVLRELSSPRNDHTRLCILGIEDCLLCEWTGQRKNLLNHIQQAHQDAKIYGENNEGISWSDLHTNEMEGCSSAVPISVFENFLWMCITDDPAQKQITFKFIFVSFGVKCNDVEVDFVIKNSTNRFVAHINMSLDALLEPDESSNSSFIVHTRTVQSFLNGPHEIKFGFTTKPTDLYIDQHLS